MPTNLLFTSWYTGLGGGETDLLSLAAELDPQRYTPHLLLPREGQLGARWRQLGYPVHQTHWRGASTFFVPQIWTRFPVVQRIADLIDQHQIALVHSNYHTLPMAYAAARKRSIPIMWTVHGWWFKPKFWQRQFFRQIDAQIARSMSIRDGFLGQPPFLPVEQLPVIYSGVDTARFHPDADALLLRETLQIAPETPVIAMIARFQKVKGHHVFQEMAREVAQVFPDAVFLVAGEEVFGVAADTRYRQMILQNAEQDPLLRDRLRYIGFRDDIEHVYAAADVVVCASEFESYGKANIEAMACGKPVVSTNQGGPGETIADGDTGYLVPADDAPALARRVVELLANPDERRRLGENGRLRAETMFSAAATATKYSAIFEALLR